MATSLPEVLATQIETEAQQAIPAAESSHIRLSPRVTELRKQVEGLLNGRFLDMYNLSRETHEQFGLLDEKEGVAPGFPSPVKVAGAFSPEDFALATKYQDPALILCPPGKTREDLLEAISAHSDIGVRGGPRIINPGHLDFAPDDQYRAFITEAANRILPCDDLPGMPLMGRLKHKANTRQPEEWGMSCDLYPPLAMQSIVRGQMIDRHTFTILDGEPIVADRLLPVGHCRKGKPTIEWFSSNANVTLSRRGRFRRVIGGRFIERDD